eukprot:CAMPEP_0182500546 /NCGR_PEP_ID=MMETSP1321-20130603/9471_1 /TAXON_ID=91990 /ORGANISM="Bolidomonas sp., Strain RCC1657" /LENGTH=257 /DNA_ID=CAMNT_0024705005 /DNA_START=115 /DNA_END=884 /DNA_ORIENTATION=-
MSTTSLPPQTPPQTPPLPSLNSTITSTLAPLSLQSFVTLSLTLDGRDKITKVIAYLSRLLSYYYLLTNSPHSSLRFSNLKSKLQESRKAFRLLKFLNEWLKLKKLIHTPTAREKEGKGEETREEEGKGMPVYRKIGMAGKIIGLAGFWTADNISYLSKASFIYPTQPAKSAKLAKKAYDLGSRCYFAGAVCHLFHSVVDLKMCLEEKGKVETGTEIEEYVKWQKKVTKCYVSFFKAICDVTVFGNNVGVFGRKLNEG